MLVDAEGKLSGIFTDSDLARLFEQRRDQSLDGPIRDVMTARPVTVGVGAMMVDAVAVMAERKISELPVVDAAGRPVGLIDITDVVALAPAQRASAAPLEAAGGPAAAAAPACRVFPAPEEDPQP